MKLILAGYTLGNKLILAGYTLGNKLILAGYTLGNKLILAGYTLGNKLILAGYALGNKLKNKTYRTIREVLKSNIKIVERNKINAPNTQIHDHSLFWLGTGTSIKKWKG